MKAKPTFRPRLPQATFDRAIALRKTAMSTREIATELGVSHHWVQKATRHVYVRVARPGRRRGEYAVQHPLVKVLSDRMREHKMTTDALAQRAGFAASAIWAWLRGDSCPTLHGIDAALEAVGLRLTVEPIREETQCTRGHKLAPVERSRSWSQPSSTSTGPTSPSTSPTSTATPAPPAATASHSTPASSPS